MKEQIEQTIKKYLKAIYQQDYPTVIALLYDEDKQEYRDTFVEFMEKIDTIGEAGELLERFNIKDIPSLQQLTADEFITHVLQSASTEIGEEALKKIIAETRITDIDEADIVTIVKYEIPFEYFGTWDTIASEMMMIYTQAGWKIFFKSGMRAGLARFERDIDRYFEQKAKDNLNQPIDEEDLTQYNLVGFKNSNGDVVFEARFKEAGDFSNGLARVKIISRYGYIDLKGDLVIKPAYTQAQDFSEGRAAVRVKDEEGKLKWGFIDKKGQIQIAPQYEETLQFSEGLCAVKQDHKWGYIDPKGKAIIPFQFSEAENFDEGEAKVAILREGKFIELILDTEGNLIG
ncbi:MAG: WG repeat-containing protein [Bacteroidota bacterium]